jgi:hypothetical protein
MKGGRHETPGGRQGFGRENETFRPTRDVTAREGRPKEKGRVSLVRPTPRLPVAFTREEKKKAIVVSGETASRPFLFSNRKTYAYFTRPEP